ncbi:MAG: hypothetical protein JWR79_1581 [Tardiphaga sp.]|jgi:hypothetical protein|nr:hypothetical protein [Tardiphaga sp.]
MTLTAMSMNDIRANSLLASTFDSPKEVLANPFLDAMQKRGILAAWASDAFAVESQPWLRQIPGSHETVSLSDILSALKRLDGDDGPPDRGGGKAEFPPTAIRTRAVAQAARQLRYRAPTH